MNFYPFKKHSQIKIQSINFETKRATEPHAQTHFLKGENSGALGGMAVGSLQNTTQSYLHNSKIQNYDIPHFRFLGNEALGLCTVNEV